MNRVQAILWFIDTPNKHNLILNLSEDSPINVDLSLALEQKGNIYRKESGFISDVGNRSTLSVKKVSMLQNTVSKQV